MLFLFVLSCAGTVEVLRRAHPLSKKSYQIFIKKIPKSGKREILDPIGLADRARLLYLSEIAISIYFQYLKIVSPHVELG
jgi:hypothetical protein